MNSRSRRLILKLDPALREGVLVIPRAGLAPDARRFAQERADWLAARLDRLPRAIPFLPGETIPVRGEPVLLSAGTAGRRTALVREEEDGRRILVSPGAPATYPDRVKRFLKAEARRDLEAAVATHADRLGVTVRRITLKDTRSRWGSCTSDGRLAFSWRLVFAPASVLDYVAAHEVAHLIEMNHSAAFWAVVKRTFGDHGAARSWLKRHGETLHALGLAVPSSGFSSSGLASVSTASAA